MILWNEISREIQEEKKSVDSLNQMEKMNHAKSLLAVAFDLLLKNSVKSYFQAVKNGSDEYGKVWDMNKTSAIGQTAILLKGKLLMDIGKFSEAIVAYEQLISFSCKNIFILQAYLDKGDAMMRLSKYKEARQCYDNAFNIACFDLKNENISEERIYVIIDEIVDRKRQCYDQYSFLFFPNNPVKNSLKKQKNEIGSTTLKAKL